MERIFTSTPVFECKANPARSRFHRLTAISGLFATLVLLAACAGEPPRETVSNAEMAVTQTSKTKASEFAALELRKAQDHLQQAKQKMEDKDYDEARRLAEKAIAEAQVAEAKSESEVAKHSVAELVDSLKALQKDAQSRSQSR